MVDHTIAGHLEESLFSALASGLVNRAAFNGVETPGRGAENVQFNDTARMHSLCFMQNFYTPEVAFGPSEISGHVTVKDDYNYAVYSVPLDDGTPVCRKQQGSDLWWTRS